MANTGSSAIKFEANMKLLLDKYNREINYLRISITDRCNLRCRYCVPEEGVQLIEHEALLTYEEILKVVSVFALNGISKIRLTGGEPLVRRGVVDLIKGIARTKGIKDLSLTTNGVLLKEFAADLVKAGLYRINISLDTLRSDRFSYITRRDKFKEVWEGIEEALRHRLSPVKINVVVIKGFNDDEIKDFARLSITYPLHVRFIEFMPVGEGNDWSQEQLVPQSQLIEEIEEIGDLIPIQPRDNDGPAKRYYMRGGKGEIGFITPISSHFCHRCNRLRLTPEGKIRTCLFSDEEIDVKGALRESENETELEDILYRALQTKPEGQRSDDFRIKKCQKYMYSIGG
jgi:cyclic pyranopterin phosphate synthase